jgi:hypothetical protein
MSGWEMLGPAALHPDPKKIKGGTPTLTPDDVRLALGGLSEKPFLFGMAAFLGHRGSMDRVEELLGYEVVALAEQEGWGRGRDRNGRRTGELTGEDIHLLQRMTSLLLFEIISARSRHDTYAHEAALPSGSATVLCPSCKGRGDISIATPASDVRDLIALVGEAVEHFRNAVRRGLVSDQLEVLRDRRRAAQRSLSAALMWPAQIDCRLCGGRGRFLLTASRRAQMLGVARRTWYLRWEERYALALVIPQRWEAIAVGHVRRKLSYE